MSPKPEPHLGTVLVVDDALDTLRMLCDALANEGYTVLVARDGMQALERLSLILPDAILLDAVMPGLSGFETCKQIKAHEVWCKIPVIFMTGLSETADVVAGFDAGGVDYVVKPVRIEEVLARLATHLRNAWGTRPRLDLAALTPRETDPGLEPPHGQQAPGTHLRKARRGDPRGRGSAGQPGRVGLSTARG